MEGFIWIGRKKVKGKKVRAENVRRLTSRGKRGEEREGLSTGSTVFPEPSIDEEGKGGHGSEKRRSFTCLRIYQRSLKGTLRVRGGTGRKMSPVRTTR